MEKVKSAVAILGLAVAVVFFAIGAYFVVSILSLLAFTIIFNLIYGVSLGYMEAGIAKITGFIALVGWFMWSISYCSNRYQEHSRDIREEYDKKTITV